MPTAPRLQTTQVSTRPMPGVRLGNQADPAAFGGASSQALQSVSKVAAQIAGDEQRKADEIAFMDADNQLSSFTSDALNNPETGFLNQKGKMPAELYQTAIEGFDGRVSEIMAGLKSEDQKLRFQLAAQQSRVKFDNSLKVHTSRELESYDTATTDAYVRNRVNDAVTDYMNPQGVRNEIGRIRSALVTHADRTGKPAEWVEAAVRTEAGRVHVGVIERMLTNGLDQPASEYYRDNLVDIPADQRDRLEKAIRETGIVSKSQAITDELLAEGKSSSETLAKAREMTDGEVRDHVVRRLKVRFAEQERLAEQASAERFEWGYNKVSETGNTDAIPRLVWYQMDSKQKESLNRHARNVAEGRKPVMGDKEWETYYTLKRMAIDNPSDFLKVPVVEYRSRFPEKEWREIAELQGSVYSEVNGEGGDGGKQIGSLRSNLRIAEDTFRSAYGISGSMDETQRRNLMLFHDAIDKDIQSREANGEKVDQKTVKEIADGMALKHGTRNPFWEGLNMSLNNQGTIQGPFSIPYWISGLIPNGSGSQKRGFELTVSDIPTKDFIKITRAYRSRYGVDPSSDDVLRIYRKGLGRARR